jgi:electron transfer flavoprotein beta subunit
MGADKAVHVSDEALHGSCAVQTAKALATVIGTLGEVDLVLAGNEASDGTIGAVPSMIAEVLGLPDLTHARTITVNGSTVTVERETDDALTTLQASLPAVVSVGEKINEPRYPSFKGIMAAKKKPVQTWGLADIGVDAAAVGLSAAATVVESVLPRPPRSAGTIVTDEGDGGARLAEYLAAQKFV